MPLTPSPEKPPILPLPPESPLVSVPRETVAWHELGLEHPSKASVAADTLPEEGIIPPVHENDPIVAEPLDEKEEKPSSEPDTFDHSLAQALGNFGEEEPIQNLAAEMIGQPSETVATHAS